jgi:hypothetical protein
MVDPTGLSECGDPHGFFDQIGSTVDCLSKGEVSVDVAGYVGVGGHAGVNLNIAHPMSSSIEGGIGVGVGGGVSVGPPSGDAGISTSYGGCALIVCLGSSGASATGFGPKLGFWASWDFTTIPFNEWGSHGMDCNPFTDPDCPWIPTPGLLPFLSFFSKGWLEC